MSNNNHHINPLHNQGTGRQNRGIPYLDPGSCAIDNRSLADMLLWAARFGQYVNFYRADGDDVLKDGNWQYLFSRDVSTILAGIVTVPLQLYRDSLQNFIKTYADQHPDFADRKAALQTWFNLLLTPAQLIQANVNLLNQDDALIFEILQIIRSKVTTPLSVLKLWLDKFNTAPYNWLNAANTVEITDERYAYLQSATAQDTLPLIDSWINSSITAPQYQFTTDAEGIYDFLNHNLVNKVLEGYFLALGTLQQRLMQRFEESVNTFAGHQPHMALYISFLKLYNSLQQELNQLPARHMDFYFSDFLRLHPADAQPELVHVLTELNKNVPKYLLPAGTLLDGGKDGNGKARVYSSLRDVVLNTATVEKLQSIYQIMKSGYVLFLSAPAANTEDGKSLDKPVTGSWKPFGQKLISYSKSGVALASKSLFTRGGDRTYTINVYFKNNLAPLDLSLLNSAEIRLTGEEGWKTFTVNRNNGVTNLKQVMYQVVLKNDDKAITGFNKKLHDGYYNTNWPILELGWVRPVLTQALLQNTIEKVEIYTDVSNDLSFVLHNDEGIKDLSKNFNLFGGAPQLGTSAFIACNELFCKSLLYNRIRIHMDFEDEPFDASDISVSYLKNGSWTPVTSFQFEGAYLEVILPEALNSSNLAKDNFYNNTQSSGYLKLTVKGKMLTLKYMVAATQMQALYKAFNALPNNADNQEARFQLAIQILSLAFQYPGLGLNDKPANLNLQTNGLSYQSLITWNKAANSQLSLFALQPFGVKPIVAESLTAFPAYAENGQLYIGLKGIKPGETVSLLLQLNEGSANPTFQKADVDVAVLNGNEWMNLKSYQYSDDTDNMTQSGILQVGIPADINPVHTLCDPELHWLRLSVIDNTTANYSTESICDIVQIHTNAVKAILKEPAFTATLPAQQISKLVTPASAVKKLNQPYEGFGGKPAEDMPSFRQRSSERLRHKDRSWNIWDYEHLVLEHFSQVYLAKCLNHSRLESDGLNGIAPGYVMVVTVPYAQPGNGKRSLQPQLSIGVLDDIKTMLTDRASLFSNIDVKNPLYEEVRFTMEVKFIDDPAIDVPFYLQKLNLDLEAYLCPWAYQNNAIIPLGGRIIKSVIIDFVEELPYIDAVLSIKMDHYTDGKIYASDVDEINASTPMSVLTSYFIEATKIRHQITAITKPITCS